MAGPPSSYRVELLTENEWPRLQDIRLTALRDHPRAFLASHDREAGYDESQWRQEFSRGEWNVMLAGDRQIGLLGVTREPDMPSQECFFEYLWVAPGFRRMGMGSRLLRTVLGRLRVSGVSTVWLYILDGNDGAMRLYQRFGFRSTNERKPLEDDPERSEEKLWLRLS